MAEEENKKPKIDLRARLGKKTVGSSGPSIPPPMTTGGSIPAPPFASKPPAPEPEQRPRVAEPQAIKIEMSEEVVAAQKKGKSKIMAIAAGTALVGAILGWAVGDGMARKSRQNIAIQGAEIIGDDIDKANLEINKMAEILAKAKRSLSDGEYPEGPLKELADVAIPFDASYLVGKGTGLMSAKINNDLVKYAGRSAEANEQKDRLQRVLGGSKEAITALLDQKEKPKFNWSVFVQNGPHGPMASMLPLPEPFLVTSKEKVKDKEGKESAYAWPEEIEVPDGAKKAKLKLYTKGNPVSQAPLLIPVEPDSQSLVCANDTMQRLRSEIEKLEQLLKGDRSDPTNEKPGLMDLGKSLMDELKGIGVGG